MNKPYKAAIITLLITACAGTAKAQAATALFPARDTLPALRLALTATPLPPVPLLQTGLTPDGYYQRHFGFFCKQEWKWERQTRFPVKLRLGNYQYTQRLEGKGF